MKAQEFLDREQTLKELVQCIIDQLKHQEAIVCSVESCTGGEIAHRLTQVPGSSAAFWGALVTYDNSAKLQLGVHKETLLQKGAVSTETARELSEQGLQRMLLSLESSSLSSPLQKKSHAYCIATTGIAGPSGGTAEKPVGLCYIALAQKGEPTQVIHVMANPDTPRIELKTEFTHRALDFLKKILTTQVQGE